MKKNKFLILSFILLCFSLTFLATKKYYCDDDCQKVEDFDSTFRKGRSDYVQYTFRCGFSAGSDTLCIYVKDTLNINWNLLADTACTLATQKGLIRQKIFFLRRLPTSYVFDTLLKKECP